MLCKVCGEASEPLELRIHAVQALGRLGAQGKSALPSLAALMKEKDETLRRQALDALGAIGPDAAQLSLIVQTIKSGDADTRRLALAALARAGPAGQEVGRGHAATRRRPGVRRAGGDLRVGSEGLHLRRRPLIACGLVVPELGTIRLVWQENPGRDDRGFPLYPHARATGSFPA